MSLNFESTVIANLSLIKAVRYIKKNPTGFKNLSGLLYYKFPNDSDSPLRQDCLYIQQN